jgi:two-component system sensor histidine kinase BaeS
MIRQSVVAKTTLLITGLVLLVLAILYITLAQLFNNSVFHNLLTGPSGQSLVPLLTIAQWLFVLAGFGATLLASGLAIILSYQLARPLVRMALATQNMTSGNYHTRVSVNGHDELAKLGASINELAQNLDFLDTTRNQFLADISHELRTPLSYIHGYAQVLREGLVKTEADKMNYLNIIYEESERIERLIKNLFDLAQADEGMLKIDPANTDVDGLIHKVVSHLQPYAAQKRTTIGLDVDIEQRLMVDPIRLEQVVFNLMDNAIRYTPPHGTVQITAVERGGILEIQVTDNGPGIPEVDLPHVWNRLYRVDKSRSRGAGGAGIGLAIVKQITELHGGSVTAQSTLGTGTSIRVRMPAVPANQVL